MRSEKQVKKALEDYETLPAMEFGKKYGLETMREMEGFRKALNWFLRGKG